MSSKALKAWIEATRPRTLPLALAGIVMGSLLAWGRGAFRAPVFGWAVLTAGLLQIISNLANDYGDHLHGADGVERIGPARAVQSGAIRPRAMLRAVVALSLCAVLAGLLLIRSAPVRWGDASSIAMMALGGAALAAAIFYTVGRSPYGYRGWGDLMVFLFFGLLSVCGVLFLHADAFDPRSLLAGAAIGGFSVGVLNLNNLRDERSDRLAGKHTLVVRLGGAWGRRYHVALVSAPFAFMAAYAAARHWSAPGYLFLCWTVPVAAHARRVARERDPARLDPELRRLALLTLGFTLLVGLGIGWMRHA